MGEIIHDALLIYNLPLTLLLGMCVLYWLSVCLGLLDFGSFDANVDFDAHIDVDLDAHVDADAGHAGAAHGDVGGDVGGGPLIAILRFMNVHEVPLMVVLSFQFLFMWVIALGSNHYLNPGESILIAAPVFAGAFIVSAILTRIVTAPLKPLMRGLKKDWDDVGPIIGNTGTVKTAEVTEDFGQVEVVRKGAPTICHARVPEGGEPLHRGDTALVIDYNTETQTCIVKRLDGEELDI